MIVSKVKEIGFTGDKSKLPYDYVIDATKWLTMWTPVNNIPMVVGESKEDCLKKLREYMVEHVFLNYDAKDFSFSTVDSEVDSGMFWPPSVGMIGMNKVVV